MSLPTNLTEWLVWAAVAAVGFFVRHYFPGVASKLPGGEPVAPVAPVAPDTVKADLAAIKAKLGV